MPDKQTDYQVLMISLGELAAYLGEPPSKFLRPTSAVSGEGRPPESRNRRSVLTMCLLD
jgi:hypothetical protein